MSVGTASLSYRSCPALRILTVQYVFKGQDRGIQIARNRNASFSSFNEVRRRWLFGVKQNHAVELFVPDVPFSPLRPPFLPQPASVQGGPPRSRSRVM